MSEVKQSSLELIGGTPILQLNNYSKKAGMRKNAPMAVSAAKIAVRSIF